MEDWRTTVRIGLWAVCLLFAIGAGGQQDPVAPAQAKLSPLELAPAKIDFGAQTVGCKTAPATATLTNRSDRKVTIRDISPSGIDFLATDTCQTALAPGEHCTIDVSFTPAISGPRLGAVVITADPPATLFLVLVGSGK
jgi:Transmembrane protein 131-like N-terminal